MTNGSIDKLDVYRGLGVREIWIFEAGAFRILGLHDQAYGLLSSSGVLPEVDLGRVAH